MNSSPSLSLSPHQPPPAAPQARHGGRIDEARERFGRADFLDFSANLNVFWPEIAPERWAAWRAEAARYPRAGAEDLGARLAAVYPVPDPAWLLPTAGGIEALYLAARLFRGRRVAVVEPGFADYARAFRAAEAEVVPVVLPPARWHVPLADWAEAALGGGRCDVVVLGNPNNPTGGFHPRAALTQVLRAGWARALAWVVDEAFVDFVPGAEQETLLPALAEHPNVLVAGSLTKSWRVPGLRLGFLATANPLWRDRAASFQPPWAVNGIARAWARDEVSPAAFGRLRRGLEEDLPPAREALRAALGGPAGVCAAVYPSAANFVLAELGPNLPPGPALYERLGAAGFLVRVAEGFQGLDPDRFVRLAVRRPHENEALLAALADVRTSRPPAGGSAPGAASRPAGPTAPPVVVTGPAEPAPAPVPTAPADPPRAAADPGSGRGRGRPGGGRTGRALSVLGTSSNSGKSWLATALCAAARRRGLRVAPFKAQNMSNNSYVTLEGGEIGRAQAAQAEACGQRPRAVHNPILLKPSGQLGAQLVVLGQARGHLRARDYYRLVDELWPVVGAALDELRADHDLVVLEGAGSPVELNLLDRDLVNLRPVRALDGRWLLVADIERGGVFAQIVGTWQLLAPADRARCLGVVVNKFRGDLSLFDGAGRHLAPHVGAPYLGTLPYRGDLQPESEDSLCREDEETPAEAAVGPAGLDLAWVRLPHLSNSQDCRPWSLDAGVRVRWITRPEELAAAGAVVLPGSKNTLADLRWLRATGLADAVRAAAGRGVPVVGICGGYQMLGRRLVDEEGVAGDAGEAPGLGLLPVDTWFGARKEVRQVAARWPGHDTAWTAYEIHMGRTAGAAGIPAAADADGAPAAPGEPPPAAEPLCWVRADGGAAPSWRPEGMRRGRVWGTYLHGLFEEAAVRRALADLAGRATGRGADGGAYRAGPTPWRAHLRATYDAMADLIEEHLNLEEVWRYVEA